MARKQDSFALIGRRMAMGSADRHGRASASDMPPIADLIRRIERALLERRAA